MPDLLSTLLNLSRQHLRETEDLLCRLLIFGTSLRRVLNFGPEIFKPSDIFGLLFLTEVWQLANLRRLIDNGLRLRSCRPGLWLALSLALRLALGILLAWGGIHL